MGQVADKRKSTQRAGLEVSGGQFERPEEVRSARPDHRNEERTARKTRGAYKFLSHVPGRVKRSSTCEGPCEASPRRIK